MKAPAKKPCRECPFRRKSAPGYLGNDTADHFLALTMRDHEMPCHISVDYERKDWRNTIGSAQHCAGAATFFANIGKLSRDQGRAQRPKSTAVFTTPMEFLKYHGGTTAGFQQEMYAPIEQPEQEDEP